MRSIAREEAHNNNANILTPTNTHAIVALNMVSPTKQGPGMALRERLKAARLERNMTVAELAEASMLSKGFISQVESGRSNPSLASLQRIASALGVPLAALWGEAKSREQVLQPPSGFRVLRRNSSRSLREPFLTLLADGPQGIVARLTLAAGRAVESAASPMEGGVATCALVGGSARFACASEHVSLSPGDVATWDAGHFGYRIENVEPAIATLLLTLPVGASLPRIIASSTPVPLGGKIGLPLGDGPFKLVAMRAGRASARRR
jgi:transcriptional regulator with XRE-family HTH domain